MFQKTMRGLCLGFLFLAFAGAGKAQQYENMPADVQQKMDQNKYNGTELLEGIKVDYEYTIMGVTDTESANAFRSFLTREFELISFEYHPQNRHVSFTMPAKYNPDVLVSKFEATTYGLGLFFKQFYHL